MAASGITVLKHNVPWGPFTREQIDAGLARGDFTLQYLAHAPGLSDWLPLGEVLDYVARREGSAPVLPPVPATRELPPVPVTVVPAPVMSPPVLPAPPPKIAEPAPVKPPSPPILPMPLPVPEPVRVEELRSAPFFLRAIAFFVDCGVIFSPVVVLFVLGMLSIEVPTWFRHESAQEIAEQKGVLWRNTWQMAWLLAIGCGWLYAAWWESSEKQATIGKRWLGLKVVDEQDERISFLRASGRYAAKYISALPCFLGFMAAILSSRGQAWHDRLAGTRVVRD
jgi:uncharacterized RDD family membrane protein YckC